MDDDETWQTNKRHISIIYRSSLLSSSISSSSYLPPHSYWVLIVILNNNIDNFTPARRQLVWMFLARQSCGRSPKEIEMGCKVPITPACNNSDDITGHLRHFGHFSLTLLNVQCPMSNGGADLIWTKVWWPIMTSVNYRVLFETNTCGNPNGEGKSKAQKVNFFETKR